MSLLSLPAVPPELKSIAPFLQRAEEVRKQDPVIAYWCAYYAAQLGIALKLKDNAARNYLFDLLGVLEKMKAEIGSNDAIEDESASSAYVENFALRVFAAADNEDRRGNATRNTAKKFLAAANFLEVLSVFTPSPDAPTTTINVPEKIRYAKWKAADIAKAFREGRKPTPGGVGEQVEAAEAATPPATSPEPPAARPDSASPPAIHRSTPPPGPIASFPPTTPPPDVSPGIPPHGLVAPKDGPTSPGEWSTVATPGASAPSFPDSGPGKSALRHAWVSDELEGRGDDPGDGPDVGILARPDSTSSDSKNVRFTPSVTGGLTPSVVQPVDDPFASPSSPSHGVDEEEGGLPPGFIPSAPVFEPGSPVPPHFVVNVPSDLPAPPPNNFPPVFVPNTSSGLPPPPPPPVIPSAPSFPPPHLPVLSNPQPQPSAHIPPAAESTVTVAPEELTPKTIARIQKHCRFAISALDYEDAETARKELRAALQMLGG